MVFPARRDGLRRALAGPGVPQGLPLDVQQLGPGEHIGPRVVGGPPELPRRLPVHDEHQQAAREDEGVLNEGEVHVVVVAAANAHPDVVVHGAVDGGRDRKRGVVQRLGLVV